jgi:Spy/CpxP family protein refolding chaperone
LRRLILVSTKWRAATVILVSVLFGVVIGAVGSHLLFHPHRPPMRHTPEMDARFIGALDRKLDLSPLQEQQVAAILKRSGADLEVLFRETRPRIRARLTQQDHEIESVLTPEQREKFRTMKRPGSGMPPG